jgi:hypothetical protein
MNEKTEQEFIDQYKGYVARRIARDLYRAMHPVGMHTNGQCRVQVEASHLFQLLKPFTADRDREQSTPQRGLE